MREAILLSSEPFLEDVEVEGATGSALHWEDWEKGRKHRPGSVEKEEFSASALKGEEPNSRRAIVRLMMW